MLRHEKKAVKLPGMKLDLAQFQKYRKEKIVDGKKLKNEGKNQFFGER